MRHKITNLVLSLIFLLQPLGVQAKKRSKAPTNLELSKLITGKLEVDPYQWNYSKVPYINFEIAEDGKAKNINTVKYKKVRPNHNNCVAAIINAEPFPEKFRGGSYGFECKPAKVYSNRQARRAKKYMKKYIKKVQTKVKDNWHPVKAENGYLATAKFVIDENGKASEIKLIKSSDNKEADKIAVRAIELASPFEKLDPEKVLNSDKKIEIEFNFNYNKYQQMSPKTKAGAAALGVGALGALGAAAIWGRPRRNRYRYRYGRYGYGRRNRPWWW